MSASYWRSVEGIPTLLQPELVCFARAFNEYNVLKGTVVMKGMMSFLISRACEQYKWFQMGLPEAGPHTLQWTYAPPKQHRSGEGPLRDYYPLQRALYSTASGPPAEIMISAPY